MGKSVIAGTYCTSGSAVAEHETQSASYIIPARVVFLTHYLPLYQVRVLEEIAKRVREFHVLLSTPIEPNREFKPDWGSLDVSIQKSITIRRRWKHPACKGQAGFIDPLYVHVPYDTGAQLRRRRPDVVMSLELGARSLGVVRYCDRHPETRSVLCTYMSEHTEKHRGRTRERLRRYLIRRCDAMTYNGPSCHSYLQNLGADTSRLYPLAYAADDRYFCRPSVRRDETEVRHRLLYVGQLSERKGVLLMLRQLADYCRIRPSRTIELRIAGNGPLRSAIEQFPTPQNLSVRLLGNVPAADLHDQMLQCGATIAPTLADEWLLVVNEALQSGLPVIGSRYAQATTTLVKDHCNGWQYDPSDFKSLVQSLEHYFVQSNQTMAVMRERCRESVAHCTPHWAARGAVRAIEDLVASDNAAESDQ